MSSCMVVALLLLGFVTPTAAPQEFQGEQFSEGFDFWKHARFDYTQRLYRGKRVDDRGEFEWEEGTKSVGVMLSTGQSHWSARLSVVSDPAGKAYCLLNEKFSYSNTECISSTCVFGKGEPGFLDVLPDRLERTPPGELGGRFAVVAHASRSFQMQRNTYDVCTPLNNWFIDVKVTDLLAKHLGVKGKFEGINAVVFNVNTNHGPAVFAFDERTKEFIGYSLEPSRKREGEVSRVESLLIAWPENVERNTFTITRSLKKKMEDGSESVVRRELHGSILPENSNLPERFIPIPNGTEVQMVNRPQIRATWRNKGMHFSHKAGDIQGAESIKMPESIGLKFWVLPIGAVSILSGIVAWVSSRRGRVDERS